MKKISDAIRFVWKNNRVWFLVTVIVLALVLIVSLVVTQVTIVRNTMNTLFGDERMSFVGGKPEYIRYKTDEGITSKAKALEAANAKNEQIAEEGIVLLKNDKIDGKDALPVATSGSAKAAVSVFGKNSVNLVYGGSGSGEKNTDNVITIHDSLREANFDVNTRLLDFYKNNSQSGSGRPASPSFGTILYGFATGETSRDKYAAVRDSYAEYDDFALVVISRIGGEGYDLPRTMRQGASPDSAIITGAKEKTGHYLQLDQNESDMLDEACEYFSKVVVVINCSTSMELGFLTDPADPDYNEKIVAALWIGNPGGTGIRALGRVLNGSVNPSGRLVNAYARNFKNGPTWFNFGNNGVASGNEYMTSGATKGEYFVEYKESIYIGYRYYETRGYTEYVKDGNYAWYDNAVVFPFGHGMSYTDFRWTIKESVPAGNAGLTKDGKIEIKVEVENIGQMPGKDVVQLYYSAPYIKGGIEKPHVVLGDFAKTQIINKGGKETVTLTLNVRDMASYDWNDANNNGYKGYELETGPYSVFIGKNANHAWRRSDLVREYNVPGGGFIYNEDVKDEDGKTLKAAQNRFDSVSGYINNYVSRAAWEETLPKAPPAAADREVPKTFLDQFSQEAYIGSGRDLDRGKPWFEAKRPAYAAKPVKSKDAVQLYRLIDKPYNDPLWDELLDQLTLSQMAYLIGTGNFNTARIENIGKPRTIDPDGPAGFVNFMAVGSAAPVYDTCFFASECVIAATWNKNIAFEMGKTIGNEALVGNERGDKSPYSGWYAPAVNIHRSPFSGRNFEYYSEDGYLSGIMGANVVAGAKTKGVYTYVKHFAVNDQETNREGVATWLDEQAMREIYLRPFEIIVKVGKSSAMMSSFNRIGTVWAGGSYELLTEILREEWGFTGMVISDYNTHAHMPANQMIRAGGDLNLIQDKKPDIKGNAVNASHLWAMRKATKNILYTVAKSNAMNGLGEGVRIVYRLPIWTVLLIVADAAIIAGLATWGFFVIRRSIKRNKVKTH